MPMVQAIIHGLLQGPLLCAGAPYALKKKRDLYVCVWPGSSLYL